MHRTRQYDLIIFDWDGTLCDSISAIVEAYQYAQRQLHLAVSDDEAIKIGIGGSFYEQVCRLNPEVSLDAVKLNALRSIFLRHYTQASKDGVRLFSYVRTLLALLHKQGYALGIATSAGRASMRRLLAFFDIASYFIEVITAEETSPKPNPQMINDLISNHGFYHDRVLMVGDSTTDIIMAKAANVDVIAISTGAHGHQQLLDVNPLHVLLNLEELPAVLEREAMDH